ncbi:RDD family protein [uncultured Methylobacterium sp.]|uniref:RDD family protein n=1 Tax=uncultured Methylobacterium sp. TaxID=157278 RepID=UPI0035CB0318
MLNRDTGYARPLDAPGYLLPATMPAVRASLGGRTVAYLLDILFILGFTALLWLAIAIVGLVTFGLGWTLFAILPASGVIYSALTVGGARQGTLGMRMMGLRVIAPESGARIDLITAAVHALLFYVAVSTFLLWLVDLAFGLARGDRRLGHDLLLGLAVVRAG